MLNNPLSLRNRENIFISSKRLKSAFSLKSLDDFWYCLLVMVIQLVCLYRSCINLKKFNAQTWQPYVKPNTEIYIYAFFLVASVFLLPCFIWSCLTKVGSYTNDLFKFGHDLDSESLYKKSIAYFNSIYEEAKYKYRKLGNYHERPRLYKYASQSAQQSHYELNGKSRNPESSYTRINLDIDKSLNLLNQMQLNNPEMNKRLVRQASTKYLGPRFKRNKNTRPTRFCLFRACSSLKLFLSLNNIWKNFMPLSSLLHVIISFGFIFPNILLIAKEIEYGFRPKGKYYY
jgi:hypothetical protein